MSVKHEHVYGVHPVQELIQAGRRRIEKILLVERRRHRGMQEIQDLAARHGIPVATVGAAELRQLVGHGQHQGVAALVAPLAYRQFAEVTALLQQIPGPHTLLAPPLRKGRLFVRNLANMLLFDAEIHHR